MSEDIRTDLIDDEIGDEALDDTNSRICSPCGCGIERIAS
jgi:hypothetical protein